MNVLAVNCCSAPSHKQHACDCGAEYIFCCHGECWPGITSVAMTMTPKFVKNRRTMNLRTIVMRMITQKVDIFVAKVDLFFRPTVDQ